MAKKKAVKKALTMLSGTWEWDGETWQIEEQKASPPCGAPGCSGHPAGLAIVCGCAFMHLSGATKDAIEAKLQVVGGDTSDEFVEEIHQAVVMARKFYGIPEPAAPTAKKKRARRR